LMKYSLRNGFVFCFEALAVASFGRYIPITIDVFK